MMAVYRQKYNFRGVWHRRMWFIVVFSFGCFPSSGSWSDGASTWTVSRWWPTWSCVSGSELPISAITTYPWVCPSSRCPWAQFLGLSIYHIFKMILLGAWSPSRSYSIAGLTVAVRTWPGSCEWWGSWHSTISTPCTTVSLHSTRLPGSCYTVNLKMNTCLFFIGWKLAHLYLFLLVVFECCQFSYLSDVTGYVTSIHIS